MEHIIGSYEKYLRICVLLLNIVNVHIERNGFTFENMERNVIKVGSDLKDHPR